jgi:hypothetical protein
MNQHVITADVYARGSNVKTRYRVYVDKDLLVERDFIWPTHEVYIKENIIVNLEPGQHTIHVEQVGLNGKIQVKNITVDGVSSDIEFVTGNKYT